MAGICALVQSQRSLSGMDKMGHHVRHETPHLHSSAYGRRVRPPGGQVALVECLCPPSLPDSAGECPGRAAAPDRRSLGLHRPATKLDGEAAEQVRALVHQSPRSFGLPTGLWTLERAADVSFAQGITSERASSATIRNALRRLGVKGKRTKHGITSPDPAYARKKGHATV